MDKDLEKDQTSTCNEHLKIINTEELREMERKHSIKINLYEILIACFMSYNSICDDMSYIDINNVVFAFLAFFLFSMVQIKVVEKLLEHLFQRSIIRNNYGEENKEFVWKYKTLKKSK